jgi:hypothetical protein
MNCPKCNVRQIEEWEIMCDICFLYGKKNEKLISEVIDDEEEYEEE